jgi:hypothetical protein
MKYVYSAEVASKFPPFGFGCMSIGITDVCTAGYKAKMIERVH